MGLEKASLPVLQSRTFTVALALPWKTVCPSRMLNCSKSMPSTMSAFIALPTVRNSSHVFSSSQRSTFDGSTTSIL